MAKPADHPGFEALLEEWNQKLRLSGFQDIETPHYGSLRLKRSGTETTYETLDPITREAKVEFFRLVGQRVESTEFPTERERDILTLFSQGHRQLAIQKMLGIEGHRYNVYVHIYRWLREWGLK